MDQVQISEDDGTLTVAVKGPLLRELVLQVIAAKYPTFSGHAMLWDLSQSDVSSLTKEDFSVIAAAARAALPPGKRRKTAYVVIDLMAYAKACKYLNEAAAARVPAEYAVFTSVPLAQKWLQTK